MNKQQFELLRMIESSDPRKVKFLEGILRKASAGFDSAVSANAYQIGGEIALTSVRETASVIYGKKHVNDMVIRGGDLYHPVMIKLRERKTIQDMDWSFSAELTMKGLTK